MSAVAEQVPRGVDYAYNTGWPRRFRLRIYLLTERTRLHTFDRKCWTCYSPRRSVASISLPQSKAFSWKLAHEGKPRVDAVATPLSSRTGYMAAETDRAGTAGERENQVRRE